MLSPWLKLATGLAATALVATGAWRFESQEIITRLSRSAALALLRQGVADGAVTLRSDSGWIFRTARLSGTASPAARAAISADLAKKRGIHAVEWRDQ